MSSSKPLVTDATIDKWVDEALDRLPATASVEDLSQHVVSEFLSAQGPFERWPCDSDDCPSRPEWDRALDDVYSTAGDEIERLWLDATHTVLRAAITGFLEQHPEAKLRAE